LGGDLEHTHLVKGLDFALLAKVQSEIEAEQKMKMESKAREAQSKTNSTSTLLGMKQIITTHGKVKAYDAPTEYKTHLGKLIYHELFEKQRPESVDVFY